MSSTRRTGNGRSKTTPSWSRSTLPTNCRRLADSSTSAWPAAAFYVWRFADRADDSVILYQRDRIRGRKRWSRFEYKRPTARRTGRPRRKGSRRQPRVVEGCHHFGAVTVEEFTALLLDCPELYKAVREGRGGDGLE